MGRTITVRIDSALHDWLEETARLTGTPKGRIMREELEKVRTRGRRSFMRLAGAVRGPRDLSSRKGFSRP